MFLFIQISFQVLIRKEIRDLTDNEWIEYKNGVLELRKRGMLDDIAKFHQELEKYAHNHDRFLPWHRMLLLFFEHRLQFVTKNNKITIPYWNWALDAEDPSNS
ncbi:Tyrosinase [Spraguea lophii 42_110]|uniref:Tyrosinase n=1 Tax=Spraguea lophii (strain 42_110) TaxID=1358809 RepID=S7XR03_SPRLO|nr:Tyrosinase [Spraguea lophii 42_110]